MVHKGEIVEKAVRASGIKLTELAKKMNLSRRHLYNLFEESNLSVEYIYKIGKIIHYDFTNEIGSYLKNSSLHSSKYITFFIHLIIKNHKKCSMPNEQLTMFKSSFVI